MFVQTLAISTNKPYVNRVKYKKPASHFVNSIFQNNFSHKINNKIASLKKIASQIELNNTST